MIFVRDLLAAGAQLAGPPGATAFADWCYDSRLMTPGSCFVALRTPRADGHDFIAAAIAAGATGVLCRWAPASAGVTVLRTDDPQAVLQRWASARLATVAPQVIGVTGSVGKTTTRRSIAALLATAQPTFQSRRSFNSLLGLPVALARLRGEHRFAVLEYGSDHPGEIEALAVLFPPQIAVVTSVGAVHLHRFGTLAQVANEFAALLAALPTNGIVIMNGDDQHGLLDQRLAPHLLRYGLGPNCDVRADAISYGLEGTRFQLHWQGVVESASIPLLGLPAVYAALAAVATGLVCGVPLASCVAALATIEPMAGRLRPLRLPSGAMLLDDTFNASPPSVEAALTTLAALPARRRIAVLGPCTDVTLDEATVVASAIGQRAARYCDALILKGDWGVTAARAARTVRNDLPITIVDTTDAALRAMPVTRTGDLVLVSGSAEARMERFVARVLMANPPDAPGGTPLTGYQTTPRLDHLLVRQEPAWRSVRIGAPDRATWLRVDLDAIATNIRWLQQLRGVPLMVVLKGDGYGHGAVRVARAALGAGASAVAVATLGEGRTLREQGMLAPILVLGYTPPWQAEAIVGLGLDCTLFDDDTARALSAAASSERRVRVHIKVDTGMARLGLAPDETGPFLSRLRQLPGLEVVGIYTHFASADAEDLAQTTTQIERFRRLLDELAAAGLRPPLAHAANSAATLRLPTACFDMIRPGIACYGLAPAPTVSLPPGLRPALSFHSEIAQIRDHPEGTPISYGGNYITRRNSRIATIPVGYADGLRRSPAWREVLVRGQRAPLVGRICMDYAMLDVTDLAEVRRGDPVVLIGQQGDDVITADDVAIWLNTINYEVVTGILPRVPREVGE
ncbi:alanine racemase [Candidatus Chloroploca sp. Khr17]|uniref:alanine racemase n=1 Tax=Candidatus Chloroploca sp. Khr17 TaxID=2496869 RepID=UPI00101DF9E6|nr:alanine racemase [Candidatus Chloroploca sp. Khr17]